MYAMLTGFLPYMMEPFNVMEMYEKMMQRKMTPVPGFLSKGILINYSHQTMKILDNAEDSYWRCFHFKGSQFGNNNKYIYILHVFFNKKPLYKKLTSHFLQKSYY